MAKQPGFVQGAVGRAVEELQGKLAMQELGKVQKERDGLQNQLDQMQTNMKVSAEVYAELSTERDKLSTDYADLERQHQSVVADRNRLEGQNKHGQSEYDKLSKQHTELSQEHSKASAELKAERQSNNELRQLLMQSQLDYARLCGYVDGLADSKPPRMVEEDKHGRLTSYPVSNSANLNWSPNGSKAWYQK